MYHYLIDSRDITAAQWSMEPVWRQIVEARPRHVCRGYG